MIPEGLTTGRVTGRFIVGVTDGVDADDLPDFIPATGNIDFVASVPYLPVSSALPPVTVTLGVMRATLDDEGYLRAMLPDGTPGSRGIRLISTNNPAFQVEGWTWSVVYRLTSAGGTIENHSILVETDSELDLTTAVRVPSAPGIGLEQAEAIARRAEAKSDEAMRIAQESEGGNITYEAFKVFRDYVIPGDATVHVGMMPLYFPFQVELDRIIVSANKGPIGQSLLAQLKVNGVATGLTCSIWPGNNVGQRDYNPRITINPLDVVTVDVLQVGTTQAGSDVVVTLSGMAVVTP